MRFSQCLRFLILAGLIIFMTFFIFIRSVVLVGLFDDGAASYLTVCNSVSWLIYFLCYLWIVSMCIFRIAPKKRFFREVFLLSCFGGLLSFYASGPSPLLSIDYAAFYAFPVSCFLFFLIKGKHGFDTISKSL